MHDDAGPNFTLAGDRRSILRLIAGAAASAAVFPNGLKAAARADVAAPSRLHLLGTGGGLFIGGERRMSCNAITVGGRAYILDCGYGATESLLKGGIVLGDVSGVFFTHYHFDHILDYQALLFAFWFQARTRPVEVYGTPPLAQITKANLAALAPSIDEHRKIDMSKPGMPAVNVHEFSQAGLVMDDGTVKVHCALVNHPPVERSLAYRFDLPDRSIVFSGDTGASPSLVELAKGADILVHEAVMVDVVMNMMASAAGHPSAEGSGAAPGGLDLQSLRQKVLKAHTSAEDAGRVAAEAGVKTLVLSHLAPAGSKSVSDGEWIAHARQHFTGEIIVARDGMVL